MYIYSIYQRLGLIGILLLYIVPLFKTLFHWPMYDNKGISSHHISTHDDDELSKQTVIIMFAGIHSIHLQVHCTPRYCRYCYDNRCNSAIQCLYHSKHILMHNTQSLFATPPFLSPSIEMSLNSFTPLSSCYLYIHQSNTILELEIYSLFEQTSFH